MAPFIPRSSLLRVLCCAAAAWLIVACGPQGATPVPQPPLDAFPIDSIGTPKADPDNRTNVGFKGRPSGSAKGSPLPGATIRVTNLDSGEPTAQTEADSLGGFTLSLPVNLGDELRFEMLLEGRRSIPADATLTSGPTDFALVPSPRFACLGIEPAYFVGFGSAPRATLTFRNRCSSAVTIDGARTRLGLEDFTLASDLPLEVAAGGTGGLTFTFTRSAADLREDVLFVDVTLAGETVRYPITLSSDPPISAASD